MKYIIKKIIGIILCSLIFLSIPVLGYSQGGWFGTLFFTGGAIVSLVGEYYFMKLVNWLLT